MAMKIPTFESQTKPGNEPANIQLGISANPSAMSQGATAQANFGSSLAGLGGQVFEIGAKLQEIKNSTEAQRLENDYITASNDIMARSVLIGQSGQDQSDWVKAEKLKLKTALLNGNVYSLNSAGPNKGEPTVYNFDSTSGKPNSIVKNNAVKKVFNASVAQRDILDDADIAKLEITARVNQQTALLDAKRENLVNDIIEYRDTPRGQIAWDKLFGSEGREEVIGPDGSVIQNGSPPIKGYLQEKFDHGLYDNGKAGVLEELQDLETLIVDTTIDNFSNQARLLDNDEDAQRVVEENMMDFSETLFEKDPNNPGRYLHYPHIPLNKRLEMKQKAYSVIDETRDRRQKALDYAYKNNERKIDSSQHDNHKLILEDISNNTKFDDQEITPGLLNKLYSERKLTKEQKDALIKVYENKKSGTDNITDHDNTIEYSTAIANAYDPSDYEDLIKNNNEDYKNNEIDLATYKARLTSLMGGKNGNTQYHKDLKESLAIVKNAVYPLESFMPMDDTDKELIGSHLNMFLLSVAEKDGAFPTKAEMEKIAENVIINYQQKKKMNADLDQMQIINVDVIDMYNSIYATENSQLGKGSMVDAEGGRMDIRKAQDPIGNNKSILKAMANNPKKFTEDMKRAWLALDPKRRPNERLFNTKLKQLEFKSYGWEE